MNQVVFSLSHRSGQDCEASPHVNLYARSPPQHDTLPLFGVTEHNNSPRAVEVPKSKLRNLFRKLLFFLLVDIREGTFQLNLPSEEIKDKEIMD